MLPKSGLYREPGLCCLKLKGIGKVYKTISTNLLLSYSDEAKLKQTPGITRLCGSVGNMYRMRRPVDTDFVA